MARSDLTNTTTGRRIRGNSEGPRNPDPREKAQADAVERLLSRHTKVTAKKRLKRRKPPQSLVLIVFKLLVVAVFVWGGIHAIVWIRDLANDYGIVWAGDE